MLEQPANFQAAEISRKRQPRLRAKAILPALAAKLRHAIRNARILPDNRIPKRRPGPPVPKQSSFALIGDSDRSKIAGMQRLLRHSRSNHLVRIAPDFFGIVLHPPRLRKNLPVLFLCQRDYAAGSIKDDKSSAGSSLIDRANEFRRHRCIVRA